MNKTAVFVACGSIGLLLGLLAVRRSAGRSTDAPEVARAPPPAVQRERRSATVPLSRFAEVDPLRTPICSDVHATIISELTDPTASLATLRVGDENGFRSCRIGDTFGRRRVRFIGTNPIAAEPRVWIERGGALCQASLRSAPITGARNSAPEPKRDLRALAGPVRATPVFVGGMLSGFRVSGVKRGSLLEVLGIRNGDVIQSVDGKDLSSPKGALEAYGRIVSKASDRLTIGVRRGRKEVAIRYRFD